MIGIWRPATGGEARARAAHDRACGLARSGIAVAVGYTAVAARMAAQRGWPLVALSLAAFWTVAALYLGTVAALAEVRTIRERDRAHRRAVRSPVDEPHGFMSDVDLVAVLLAAVLPFVIIMCFDGMLQPHR